MQQATRSSGWLNSFRTSHSRAAQLAARIFYFRGHTTAKSSRPSNFHKICGPLLRARGHDDTPPGLSWRPESPAVLPSGVHELFDLRFHVFAEQKHRMGYSSELSGSPERQPRSEWPISSTTSNALSSCATSPSHDWLVLRKATHRLTTQLRSGYSTRARNGQLICRNRPRTSKHAYGRQVIASLQSVLFPSGPTKAA
jgi:hypothetical protein